MSSKSLYVSMTMDVERIIEHSPLGGPPTWEFSERSVRNYCNLLAERGLPATLFVVPDTALIQGQVLLDVARETGSELGMHMHPQCWGNRYQDVEAYDHLGGYTGREQYEIISAGLKQISEGLGVLPRAFRGGNFSANDETFGVLTDLGFTHGSLSQPGRRVTRFKAVWKDACLDVHRANREFRGAIGDLDFVEVPLTSDQERTDHWTGVGDVRIEGATSKEIAKAVLQEVGRQVREGVPVKHVCLLTHNFVNYWSTEVEVKGRQGVLLEVIDRIKEISNELGLKMIGITVGGLREVFLQKEASGM